MFVRKVQNNQFVYIAVTKIVEIGASKGGGQDFQLTLADGTTGIKNMSIAEADVWRVKSVESGGLIADVDDQNTKYL